MAEGPLRVRQHRGSLADSLLTSKEIAPTMEALVKEVKRIQRMYFTALELEESVTEENLDISYYGYDDRVNEHIFHVNVKGQPPAMIIINRLPEGVVLPL